MTSRKQFIYPLNLGLLALLPSKVFAHEGAEEPPPSGLPISVYGLMAISFLFILFVTFYLVVKKKEQGLKNGKKKEDRIKRQQLEKNMQILKWGWILSLLGVVITGSLSVMGDQLSAKNGTYLEHVHGLGYSIDGKQIIIPSHDGLKTYSDGHWGHTEGEKHDYMGFVTVDDGFYSSGHPAPGSDKKNPFGVVKSTNEGKSFKTLDLYGTSDFHMMGVGYQSHAIYVMNPEPNSRMDSTGLYYSTDETKTWTESAMNGISEDLTSLAVHPSDKAMLAIGTKSGVYLSKDYGQNFEKVLSKSQVTSLFFNANGTLFVAGYDQQAYLLKVNVKTKQSDVVNIPDLNAEEAIAYIAENPVNVNEMAFATFNKDVYVSHDNGSQWIKVADQGTGISKKSH